MHEQRINDMNMTLMDVLKVVAEGNPGALSVCLQAIKATVGIDPDCAWGEMGPLIGLDSFGIYGSDIWVLYSDVCNRNIEQFLGVLRACQLGLHSSTRLRAAIDFYQGKTENKPDWKPEDPLAKVKERLPDFGAKQPLEETA